MTVFTTQNGVHIALSHVFSISELQFEQGYPFTTYKFPRQFSLFTAYVEIQPVFNATPLKVILYDSRHPVFLHDENDTPEKIIERNEQFKQKAQQEYGNLLFLWKS
jgi:hypothetical protein